MHLSTQYLVLIDLNHRSPIDCSALIINATYQSMIPLKFVLKNWTMKFYVMNWFHHIYGEINHRALNTTIQPELTHKN